MRKLLLAGLLAGSLSVAAWGSSLAHFPCTPAGPANESYAKAHIVAFAHAKMLGTEHKPGTHMGYAGFCHVGGH